MKKKKKKGNRKKDKKKIFLNSLEFIIAGLCIFCWRLGKYRNKNIRNFVTEPDVGNFQKHGFSQKGKKVSKHIVFFCPTFFLFFIKIKILTFREAYELFLSTLIIGYYYLGLLIFHFVCLVWQGKRNNNNNSLRFIDFNCIKRAWSLNYVS